MPKKKYDQWYKTTGLKHVTGFLTVEEKAKLKKLATAADKSLSRYVTRLMQQHIRDMEEAELRRQLELRKVEEEITPTSPKSRKESSARN